MDAQLLRELINRYLTQDLKELGYLRKGTTWNRRVGKVVDVLDLQKGRTRSDGTIDFTLNVGLWMEEVWTVCWGDKEPRFIREEQCFPRFRIGFLLEGFNPKFHDKWWLLDSDQTVISAGEELRGILKGECLPFFERFNNSESVLRFVETTVPIGLPLEKLYLAILQFLCRRTEQSWKAIKELENDPYWGHKTRDVVLRLRDFPVKGE